MIDLDAAATTPAEQSAIDAMLPFFKDIYGNPHSVHAIGRNAAEFVELARKGIAETIGATPEEIVFTSGGTDANTTALLGMAPHLMKTGKTHIITTAVEHKSVLDACRYLEKIGFSVTYLRPKDTNGRYELKDFENALTEKTGMVSAMFVNNETGALIAPTELDVFCDMNDVVYHSDWVQAYSKFYLNVRTEKVDLASVSGHKFGAPKGIGFLYVRKGVPIEHLHDGTQNVPYIAGLWDAARSYHIPDGGAYSRLRCFLDCLPNDVKTNGNSTGDIVSVYFPGVDAETMVLALSAAGIMSSAGAACNSVKMEPSHVLMAMGFLEERAKSSVRFSFQRHMTKEAALEAAEIISAVYESLLEEK